MGFFKRLFQKKEQLPQDLAEQRARAIAQAEELYVLLSIRQANLISGVSAPYIGQLEDGNRILLLFETYELAKTYIDRNGYEVLEGIYPIGQLSKNHPTTNLTTILAVARQGGVTLLDINPTTDTAYGCQIDWFMTCNHMDKGISLILSEKEADQFLSQDKANLPLTFPPIPIARFSNPYRVSDERGKQLLDSIFQNTSTAETFFATFYDQQSLHENCFVADFILGTCMPKAEKDQNLNDLAYFQELHRALGRLVWTRLDDTQLYVLKHRETGQLHLPNDSLHVLYTDLFKYMGHFDYQPLANKEELVRIIKDKAVKQLAVTDGPHWITLINTADILTTP